MIIERLSLLEGRAEESGEIALNEVDQYLNCPQPSEPREKGSRVTHFREKNKAVISALEAAIKTLDQQVSTHNHRIEMKHCNLAGRHGKPFNQKMCQFSRQSLKTELDLEISNLKTELARDGRMKSQKMKKYIGKLNLLQEQKHKYLSLIQEQEQELDLEIAKFSSLTLYHQPS